MENGNTAVADPDALFNENPQLKERGASTLADHVALPRLDAKEISMSGEFSLCEHPGPHRRETRVYFVIVEGEGSYIVDRFVARHELPDFDSWPDTFACLVAVVSDYAAIDENLRYLMKDGFSS